MIVTDIETTGTNSEKHSIVSIGAIDMNSPERTFYAECKIWEGAHIEEKALEINDMTLEDATDQSRKTEAEIVADFLSWAMDSVDHTIAAHNPVFDLSFLEEAAGRAKINFPLARRSIDQHSVAVTHMLLNNVAVPIEKGRTAINSDFIMKYVGIPAEPRPHNALNGALWEAEALSRMLFNKNLLDQFKDHQIPWIS
jgi:DNA polymerase III epsilon subunit-like protein